MNGKADSKWCFVMVTIFLAIAGGQANAEFVFGPPTNLGPTVNSPYGDLGAYVTADGLELFFNSTRPGGSGDHDLWVTTRPTVQDLWGEPVNLGPLVNDSGPDFGASLSPDGLELYIGTIRPGGLGGLDIWVTRRADRSAAWEEPINLGSPINTESNDAAILSADGLSLLICSDRSGGYGGQDLWVSARPTPADPWSNPVNLGPTVNTSVWDWNASLSADGLLLFYTSHRPGGLGNDELWLTTRETATSSWTEPLHLPHPINTADHDGLPCVTADGSILYFTSNRPDGVGETDLWQASIEPVVDFNGDYKIDIEDLLMLIKNWSTSESLYDIGPMPWGDGTVDAADLEVLMSYWGQELVDPDLLARWELDETEGDVAHDSAGDNDAVVVGGAIWRPSGGQIGGALELDGMDDSVVTDFVVNPVDGPFSVSVWVKGGAPGQVAVAQADGTRPGAAWISADPSGGKLMSNLMFPLPPLVSDVVITDGQWHRVVLTWDGQRRQLYVDEASAASDLADLPATIPSDGGLRFGADKKATPGSFFCGLIDDVRIYNRAVKP